MGHQVFQSTPRKWLGFQNISLRKHGSCVFTLVVRCRRHWCALLFCRAQQPPFRAIITLSFLAMDVQMTSPDPLANQACLNPNIRVESSEWLKGGGEESYLFHRRAKILSKCMVLNPTQKWTLKCLHRHQVRLQFRRRQNGRPEVTFRTGDRLSGLTACLTWV